MRVKILRGPGKGETVEMPYPHALNMVNQKHAEFADPAEARRLGLIDEKDAGPAEQNKDLGDAPANKARREPRRKPRGRRKK